jgi:hypothetical protein
VSHGCWHGGRSPESINVCVCSFSEDRDSLSQWRAYGGPSGFALGFPSEVLNTITEKRQWFLVPCIYYRAAQRRLARALVEEVLEENLIETSNEEERVFKSMGGNLLAYLNRYAPILKDESFKEEREWRIISRPLSSQRLDYREGRSLIVPYCKLPLCDEGASVRLHEIVIGPTPDAQRSKISLTSFVQNQKVTMLWWEDNINIMFSKVPYRDW